MSLEDALKAREVPRVPSPGNRRGTEKPLQYPQRSPGSPGSPAKQWGRGSTDESPARDTRVEEAARAAGIDPGTVEALLSDDDREDLAAGALSRGELTAYARSVAARWARGYVLPDERELATAWLRDEVRS